MKISGQELAAFLEDGWPGDDWYWEHDLFDPDPDPGTTYDTNEIEGLFWQGCTPSPTKDGYLSLDGVIRKWRKARENDLVSAWVPKGKAEDAKAALMALGGTLV